MRSTPIARSAVIGALLSLSAVGCGEGGASPATATSITETTVEPLATVELALLESAFASQMPSDFEASFSQDGGMAPWSESVTIGADEARYEVWMEEVEVIVMFTPPAERIEALYTEIRLSRFDTYETYDLDEVEYDGGSESWRVEAGGETYRVARSGGQNYRAPDTEYAPLSSMSTFVDMDVSTAATTGTIVFDPALRDLSGTEVTIDLRGQDFAIGDDRWNDVLEIAWSSDEPFVAAVTATRFEESIAESITLTPGASIVVRAVGDTVEVEAMAS